MGLGKFSIPLIVSFSLYTSKYGFHSRAGSGHYTAFAIHKGKLSYRIDNFEKKKQTLMTTYSQVNGFISTIVACNK